MSRPRALHCSLHSSHLTAGASEANFQTSAADTGVVGIGGRASVNFDEWQPGHHSASLGTSRLQRLQATRRSRPIGRREKQRWQCPPTGMTASHTGHDIFAL